MHLGPLIYISQQYLDLFCIGVVLCTIPSIFYQLKYIYLWLPYKFNNRFHLIEVCDVIWANVTRARATLADRVGHVGPK